MKLSDHHDFTELQDQLKFYGKDHTYKLNGVEIPSVTTVLGAHKPIPKFLLMKDSFKMLTSFGKLVHACVEADCNGFDRPEEHMENAYKKADMVIDWLESVSAEVVAVEQRVFEGGWWFCGTFDLLVYIDNKLTIIDVKTSAMSTRAKYQVGAYWDAMEFMGIKIDSGLVVSVKEDEVNVKSVSQKNREKWREIMLAFNKGEFDE